MRVLFLSASGQLGGAEASLIDVLASLRRAEPDWDLRLAAPAPGPLAARAAALGVPASVVAWPEALARLGESRLSTFRLAPALAAAAGYGRELRRAIADVGPDIVHTNGLKMHVLAARAVPRAGPALVWHLHDYLGPRAGSALILRSHRSRCAHVVANSESVAADARAMLGDRLAVTAVPNAIDLDRFSPAGEALDLDALAGLPPAPAGTIRVGLLATFARWKGHEIFLEALSRLPAGVPVRGFVIGAAVYQTDGSQYTLDGLRARAAALGLDGRVGFTGFVDRPEAALRALHIAVHASTAPEPFGLAIVEAMACARAVVAAEGGGAAEIVTPGVDALVHRPGDAAGLASTLRALASDGALRARLAGAARQTAVRRFDRGRLAGALVPIYRAACGRRMA